ncbi:hypothetical protein APS67_005954 [Streptomyces sp. AVP053U2]|nr:hypothetical protein APS67_005954 [Streptomyces sp. AVP053U2]
MKTNRLMGAAEAITCVALAGMCISLAVGGHPMAWLFGFGSLSFAWDLWRRFDRTKAHNGDPTGQHDH